MKIKSFASAAALLLGMVLLQPASAQSQDQNAYPPIVPIGYQTTISAASPYPGVPVSPAAHNPMAVSGTALASAASMSDYSDLGGGCGCGAGETCAQCCCSDCGYCFGWNAFGEFLYLRSRNTEVAYGIPMDGPVVPPNPDTSIPVGPIGVTDFDFDAGFRFGVGYVFDQYSSLTVQYTMFETTTADQIAETAPNVIRSLVAHPSSLSATQNWLQANAAHSLTFDMIDADYRYVFDCCDDYLLNYLVGVRYTNMEQRFRADFANIGTDTVITDIDFDGIGLRFGLEGERYAGRCKQFILYGKTYANFIGGEFDAYYTQQNAFDPTVAETSWTAGRLVTQLDLEVGIGWRSRCDTWRATVGYMYSGWFNTVKTDEWIQSVQSNNFVDLSGGMSFDGLTARIEGRF